MILTVNLGNTHITIGGYEHDDLKFCGRLHTDPAATVDEYGLRLLNLLSLHGASPEQIEGGGFIGCSLFPPQSSFPCGSVPLPFPAPWWAHLA